MAERRMFSKEIIDSDAFLDMPVSTQNLYFHLGMRADDQGFVNSPNKIMNTCKASKNDIELLVLKSFIIPFESGVVVIKHWLINNLIRADRLKPTRYQEEYAQLNVKINDAYSLTPLPYVNQMTTKCQPNDRVGKDSIGKDSIVEDSINNNAREENHLYGEYQWIKLTDSKYKKLLEDYGQALIDKTIAKLDEYLQGNGNKNKYKDFNLVIRRAIRDKWFGGDINCEVLGGSDNPNGVIRNIEDINIDEEEM